MDAYLYGHYKGDRFRVQTEEHCDGGGFNTLSNAYNIVGKSEIVELRELMNVEADYMNTLTRLRAPKGFGNKSFWDTPESKLTTMCLFPWYDFHCEYDTLGHGLILSDYNKGALNRPHQRPVELHAEFLVADSRYRTLHPDFMGMAKTKIWHATGLEYNWDWAQEMGFDYVFRTNGGGRIHFGPVSVEDKHRWEILEVPDIKAVDTCGAGDTFTAAVGAYLAVHHARPIDMALLREAGGFAIECCQEVIQQPRTAVTTKRL